MSDEYEGIKELEYVEDEKVSDQVEDIDLDINQSIYKALTEFNIGL